MSSYSIKDLEHLSGIKAHTLRIWEQRYGILNPDRSDTNIRSYGDKELKLVLNIALLQEKGGFKISEIAKMSDDDIFNHILSLSQSALDYPEQIQALTIAMLDLDESKFQQLTQNIVKKQGFDNRGFATAHQANENDVFSPVQRLLFGVDDQIENGGS
mgnify:CR=1 FL=1